jgi:hypothetical protein
VKFVNLIKKFVETHKNHKEMLIEMATKLENIDVTKIKDQNTLFKILYAVLVINVSINESNNTVIDANKDTIVDTKIDTKAVVKNDTVINTIDYDKLILTVYDDKRCTNCPTDEVLNQLKLLPSLSGVNIVKKDFSEA